MNQNRVRRLFFWLFSLCIFTLSLGQFSVIYAFGQGNIYLFDLLITLFDFFGLIYLLKLQEVKIPISFIFLFSFVALGIVSLVFTPLNLEPSEFLTSLAYPLRFLSYILFALITHNFIRLDFVKIDRIYRVIIYSGLFLFVAGIFQLLVLPDLETLDSSLGWDPHKNRMVSTFFDPNFLGMYFVICLATIIKLFKTGFTSTSCESSTTSAQHKSIGVPSSDLITESSSRLENPVHQIKPQPILFLAGVIFIAGIFLTFSRSAWLATAVLIFFVGLKNKVVLLSTVAIVFLAVFAVPRVQTRISGITDPQDSASFRLVSWQNTWEIIKENWVFGIGYNTFRYAQQDYGFLDDMNTASRSGAGSDSSLLLVWATSGISGLIFFAGFFIFTIATNVKHPDITTTGLVFALLLNSIFINSIFYPQILVGIMLIVVATKGFEPLTPAM